MSYGARWGPKRFHTSPSQIIPFNDFSTSVELKSDSKNDTSGKSPQNTRGLLLRPFSFSVPYYRASGTDPRAQLTEWESLVGQSYPLYIGGKRFGPNSMILKKVDASDFAISPNGDITGVVLKISMEEDANGKTTNVIDSSYTTSSSEEKKKAMNATASAEDRARLSLS